MTSSPSSKPERSAAPFSEEVDVSRLLKDGRRWLIRYQIGALLPGVFGFCVVYFREELGIVNYWAVFTVILMMSLCWCLYVSWLSRLIMHSFWKLFGFLGLVAELKSSWFQILPPWLQEHEEVLEKRSGSLHLGDALRGSLIYVHELRNRLQAISTYLNLALRLSKRAENNLLPAKDELVNAIEISKGEAKALDDFVSSLCDLAIGGPEIQEQFDLWAAIEMSVKNRDPESISVDLPIETPLMVRGCKPIVQQVIANVINNACKYGKKNKDGNVKVFITQSASMLASNSNPKGQMQKQSTVFVYDGGDNLTKDQERKAFRLDSNIRAVGTSFGFGLALSRHLMLHQGGNLQFERGRRSGYGKCVSISLPRADLEDASS